MAEPARINFDFGIRDPMTGKPSRLGPRQLEYIRRQWHHRYNVAYGGAGSGKTEINVFGGLLDIFRHADIGLRVLFAHTDKTEAHTVLIRGKLHKQLGMDQLMSAYRKRYGFYPWRANKSEGEAELDLKLRMLQDGTFEFDPKLPATTIAWMGLSEETGQIEKLLSHGDGFDLVIVTQLEQFSERAFDAIRTRLGRRSIPGFRPRLLADANAGTGWLKRMIGDHQFPGTSDPADFNFVHFTTYDNAQHLTPDYIKGLEQMPDAMKQRYLWGTFSALTGMVYQQFERAVHVVPFSRIPFSKSWRFSKFIDWGQVTDPCATVWVAKDHVGNFIVIGELELYGLEPRQAADQITKYEHHLVERVAEHCGVSTGEMMQQFDQYAMGGSDFSQKAIGLGRTVADLFYRDPSDSTWQGFTVMPIAQKAKGTESIELSAISNVTNLITCRPEHHHLITGAPHSPHFYVADSCVRAIAQIEYAEWEKDHDSKPERMNRNRIKNVFETGGQERRHHWDLESCIRLAAQEFTTTQQVEQEGESEDWKRYQSFVNPGSKRKGLAGYGR